jgi:type II secretory pathway pseudopilin PulG
LTSFAFTLVEMSFVLIVIGLVLMLVLPTITSMRNAMAQKTTAENLQALMRATAAFVQANGCVPCPAPASVSGTGFGRLRGDASTTACAGCTTWEGIPPFVALGVPAALARDGWGRWVTMRVDPALTAATLTTVPPSGALGLCAAGLATTNRPSVRQPNQATTLGVPAAVVFVSHGANGSGAYTANPYTSSLNGTRASFPASQPACATNQGYERCNAAGTGSFVESTPIMAETDPYDDKVLYLGRNALVAAFGSTACTTTW